MYFVHFFVTVVTEWSVGCHIDLNINSVGRIMIAERTLGRSVVGGFTWVLL